MKTADRKRALDRILWNKWSKGKSADIRSDGAGFVMDAMPFKARIASSSQDDKPFVYEAEGKFISFKPSGMWWTTPEGDVSVKVRQDKKSKKGKLIGGKVKYLSAFGSGVDIEMSTETDRWRKEVVIKSLASLGKIPSTAEYLEIGFEVETDFDLEWDGEHDLQFDSAIALSELSRLNPIATYSRGELSDEQGEPIECKSVGFLRVRGGKKYLVKRLPVEYLKQAVFPLITDATISYGSEYAFTSATIYAVACAALDATHFVVCYSYYGGNQGSAKVGTVSSGDEIAYGSEYQFSSAYATWVACDALDSTHFVVGYVDATGDKHGNSKIGVVSSVDNIAFGSEVEFNGAEAQYVSCSGLDATHFVVSFMDQGGDDYGIAMIGVVSSGDVIAYGSEYAFNSAITDHISCAALDSTHFAVAFRDAGNLSYGTAMIGVVSSGDQIAYGSEYIFSGTSSAFHVACAALDSTHFVIAYAKAGSSGEAIIGVVSFGDEIAYGTGVEFNSAVTRYTFCSALDSTNFAVSFQDDGGSDYGIAMIGTVASGDEITFGAEAIFNSALTVSISCAALDSTHFVVGFKDDGGADYGIAMIGVVAISAVTSIKTVMGVPIANIKTINGVPIADVKSWLGISNVD